MSEVWEMDLMPSKDVVLDFYKICQLTVDQQTAAQWQVIAEEDLADHVPGLDIVPYAQWRVVSGNSCWMIYQWYSSRDDEYLYEDLKDE